MQNFALYDGLIPSWGHSKMNDNDIQILHPSGTNQASSILNTPPLPLGENKTLMDTLADLDCIDGRVEELELDAPPDPAAVANARALIEKIHDIYPARYHVSPTERRGVAIEAPVKKAAAVSLECAPNDIVYCFVAINGKRRRAKFYQMTDLPDPFIKTALQDLAKG